MGDAAPHANRAHPWPARTEACAMVNLTHDRFLLLAGVVLVIVGVAQHAT
jgi:hypothetical protein